MKKTLYLTSMLLAGSMLLMACGGCEKKPSEGNDEPAKPVKTELTDDELLDKVQQDCFEYMWSGAEPTSGLAYERIHLDGDMGGNDPDVITTGGSGFGIAGLVVGMERGFITRADGVARLKKIVDYLARADRFHGVWSHWIKGPTGKVVPFGTKDNGADLVESSFLMQGLLCARQYMNPEVESEKAVIDGINELWQTMEFDWFYRQRADNRHFLYWHWSPDYGWEMNFPLEGYNECFIVYLLAAASPTHTTPKLGYYEGWSRGGDIKSAANPYGHPLLVKHNGAEANGGPLFWAHYSWFGMDPHFTDPYGIDYWQVVQNHALANYDYCVTNPKGYSNYSSECWGLTASYSPSGYEAHQPTNDPGVITPTAALSSFPYTPEQSMAALRYFYRRKAVLWKTYGPIDAFSDTKKWYPHRYLAIDQLTIAPMIENYRSGLLWKLFMSCPEVKEGMQNLGMTYNGKY